MALLTLDVTQALPCRKVPESSDEVLRDIEADFGQLSLKSVLSYVWSLGIPVLPLNDQGAFHGACWRIDGRNVIVLKQKTQSEARWIVDLLHELFHASQHQEREQLSAVDAEDPLISRKSSEEEQAAVSFSCDVALRGRAEELVQLCVRLAGGKVERLKSAVSRIANQERVRVDILANYAAYRLAMQRLSWWPTAQTLQVTDANPWQIVRDRYLEMADFSGVNASDRELLLNALARSQPDNPGE